MPMLKRPGGAVPPTALDDDQIYFMRREIANASFALFGLALALLVLARIRGWACLARYHHQPRKGTLASLLNAMIQALFVLNAVYAFAFLAVAVVEVGYLSSKGKAKLYGEEGTWSDEATLQSWGKAYSHMTHVLQQLSLLPQFWHCALAWLFYAYIVQGRTAAALERIVRERIVWHWLAAVVIAAGVSAMCFYAPAGSKLHQAEVLWTATTTSVSLLVVLSLYIQTLYHWRRGSSHGGSYGGASTKGTAAAGSALGRGRASSDGNSSTQDLAQAEAGGAGGSFRLPRSDSPTHAQAQAQQLRRPLWRLVALLAFFLAIGTWALVNECRAAAAALGGYSGRRGTGDMPIVILTVVDALVLGNVLFCLYPSCLHPGRRRQRKQQRALSQRRQQLLLDQQRRRGAMAERKGNHGSGGVGGSGGRRLAGSGAHSTTALQKRSQGSDSLNSGVVLRPQSRQDRQLRIFASTFNAGSTKSCAALGPVDAWVPPGFDLYIIGIQECMVVDELGAVIHKHLGGPSQYVAHADGVWSTNGEIALLLFARAEDAASGAFELLGGLTTKVNLGASVGVGNLPNKAALGLACRLHDRALACVTAHFAADKHGKERPEARVRDAVRSLKGLSLGGECEEVDLQHAFHHVVVLGDLNFRVRLPPECVVQRLAASVGEEKKALARLLLSGGGQDRQPAAGAPFAPPLAASASALSIASTNSSLGSSSNGAAAPASIDAPVSALARPMRLARYQSAVQGLPQPPPFGSQVSLARTNSREGAEGGDGAPCPSTASSDETTTVEEGQSDVVVEIRGEEEEDVVVVAQEQQAAGATTPSNATAAVIDAPGYYHQLCPPESPMEAEEGDEAEARRLREWWRWVQEHDELGRVMRAGACFHGFVEGPLCFPPSFRWVRGARANYSLEGAAAFDGCYTLVKASEGAKGLRPPSFTDRVLVHSLPDLAGDMAIEEYDMCEAMTGSDHRPVAAALRLTVDASPAASQGRRADKEQTMTTTRTRKLVVALSDVFFVSLGGGAAASSAGARPSLSPVSSSSSTVPLEHAEGEEGKAEETDPAPRPSDGERWLPRLMSAMGYRGGSTAAQGPMPVPAADALSALIVHYPLLMEDSVSLAEQRKAAEMKEGLEQGFALGRRERKREREAREAAAVAAILDSDGSAGAIADTELSFGQAQGVGAGVHGGQGSALHHLDSVHTLSLKRHARRGGDGGDGSAGNPLSFRVAVHESVPRGGEDEGEVLPGLPHYAVVRVRDRRKGEIGQAVMCLREALPRARRRRTGKGDGGGEEEEEEEDERERGAFLEASVCDGGRLVGRLLLRAEVLTEEEERRRRKRELQERVGFLASANATTRGLATNGVGRHAGSLS